MLDKTKMSKPYPAQEWRMPPLSTIYLCDDGVHRTIGEMLEGIEEDLIPKNDEDFLFMLDMFGADWTGPCITFSPSQREEALQVLDRPRFTVLN